MAKLIQVIAWLFRLGLIARRTDQLDVGAPCFEGASQLPGSRVLSVLHCMQVLTLCLNPFHSAVRWLPGIGTFTQSIGLGTPTVGSGGRMCVTLHEAPVRRYALSADGAFRSETAHRAKMGMNGLPPPR